MNKQKNLVMIGIAAVILVAVNLGVMMASSKGAIEPVGNMGLWLAFVVLNIASILWATTLLGLQPLVISFSYVVGALLAFLGVRNAADVSVAEVITAGATYGAFGALAFGNATEKVRLAFYNKKQVPFIFIIVGLLVIDAGLNSGISSSGVSVIVKAVALPFVVAGVVVGLGWSFLNSRFKIGRTPSEILAEIDAGASAAVEEDAAAKELVINMPEETEKPEPVVETPAPEPVVAKPAPAPKPEPVKTPKKPAPAPTPEPVVAAAAPVQEEKEEEFFPLEIDTDESDSSEVVVDDSSFVLPTFDASLYTSGAAADNKRAAEPVAPPPPVAEEKPAAEPEAEESGEEEKKGDWLGGHLDLLNKLK